MDHNGVTLNITYLICAWRIYTYMVFTVYAQNVQNTCVATEDSDFK